MVANLDNNSLQIPPENEFKIPTFPRDKKLRNNLKKLGIEKYYAFVHQTNDILDISNLPNMSNSQINPIRFDENAVKEAFLRTFTSTLENFEDFLILPPKQQYFDKSALLNSVTDNMTKVCFCENQI